MTFSFTVNNINLLPYIAEDGLEWTRFDVEAPDTGHTLDGVMHRGRVAVKICMVAEELAAQLQALSPAPAFALYPLPAAASIVPPGALNSESRPSLDGLSDAIAGALAALQPQNDEPVIRVYLDGKQISDAVTKYQRRADRAAG